MLSLGFPPPTEGQELSENPIGTVVVLLSLVLALLDLLIYLVTVVVFLIWLYRAYDNLRGFDQWSRPTYSPGFVVGSFFIPFANLFVPYRAVKELWQKSRGPNEALLSEPSPPASFPLWWLFWLCASFAANISFRLTFTEKVPESTATIVTIFADALFIVSAFLFYVVIDSIDKRQEGASAKLNLVKLTAPPPPPTYLPEPATPAPSPNDSAASWTTPNK
jgi:hypothetical protein